ncbi:DUF790 family protein [Halovivax sp.]|uniref:DUF790 family protein n=1 Tax=Halovivax sp. TaxID=1935978 RepID=UPI0025B9207C|nr:DUF790 family protein [Halovivax sp.]
MLTKDLLGVSRAGGGYRPRFADREHRPLAARVIGTFQDHVGEARGDLDEALATLESEAADFKLVRGFASLCERDAAFETRAPVEPERARRAAFEAAEAVGVVSEDDRAMALIRAGEALGASADGVAESLYADREERQVLVEFGSRWDPDALLVQYNLSLAQTALFDATEVRVRSADPRALVAAVKRLRLMYELRRTGDGRELVVTGPTAVDRSSRRYGTRFARLLRTVAGTDEWRLEATIDDRGTERSLELSDADPVAVPDADPVADVSYDSEVEADFAGRFQGLDLPWELVREPEPLATGTRVMIPDFAFDYRHAEFRVHFEIVGFWTPEYVAKKLDQLAHVEDVELLVAVDESLGIDADLAALDHRVVPYAGRVRVKDVADVLREFEGELVDASAADLPDELVPDDAAVGVAELADRRGVSEAAIDRVTFPEHERVGRTLVRPEVLSSIDERLEPGQSLAEAEAVLDDHGVGDASAALSRLGYRVEWEGLSGGTVRRGRDR